MRVFHCPRCGRVERPTDGCDHCQQWWERRRRVKVKRQGES